MFSICSVFQASEVKADSSLRMRLGFDDLRHSCVNTGSPDVWRYDVRESHPRQSPLPLGGQGMEKYSVIKASGAAIDRTYTS